jgi:hypothetical protein
MIEASLNCYLQQIRQLFVIMLYSTNPNPNPNPNILVLGGIHPFLIETGIPRLPSIHQREKVAAIIRRLVKSYSPRWKLPMPFYRSDPAYQNAR